MTKNKFYYIFILTISMLIVFNLTSAAAENYNDPSRNFFDEIQKKVEKKVKQTIKEKSKEFIQNRIEWAKRTLNPLKIQIQQGSDIIRRAVNRIKDYLKDLF